MFFWALALQHQHCCWWLTTGFPHFAVFGPSFKKLLFFMASHGWVLSQCRSWSCPLRWDACSSPSVFVIPFWCVLVLWTLDVCCHFCCTQSWALHPEAAELGCSRQSSAPPSPPSRMWVNLTIPAAGSSSSLEISERPPARLPTSPLQHPIFLWWRMTENLCQALNDGIKTK